MSGGDAVSMAADRVDAARDSPTQRLLLAAAFYRGDGSRSRYGQAELSFLRWEIGRGVLGTGDRPGTGSPWWRAVNDRLLRDKAEARLLHDGTAGGPPSARSVELWLEFLDEPSAGSWYRAHNASIVGGYLDHERLAAAELPAERVMINVALFRVLFTHTMVAHPRLALGLLAPLGRLLGDPRGASVRLFLDLRHSFPSHYPLTDLDVERLVREEGRIAQALDYGIVLPRVAHLYTHAASTLDEPRVDRLHRNGTPCYALAPDHPVWDHHDAGHPLPRLAALLTRPGRRRVLSLV